jgi:hypothetical protein
MSPPRSSSEKTSSLHGATDMCCRPAQTRRLTKGLEQQTTATQLEWVTGSLHHRPLYPPSAELVKMAEGDASSTAPPDVRNTIGANNDHGEASRDGDRPESPDEDSPEALFVIEIGTRRTHIKRTRSPAPSGSPPLR